MSDESQIPEDDGADIDAGADAEQDMLNAAEENDFDADTDGEEEEYDPQVEIKELNDKLLRAMAETENTRRIATRERQDASKYAVTNFAREILRVADNLGFALMSVTEEARAADKNMDNLYVGIDMTMKELLNVFEGQGIKPVAAEGQRFDHNIHEAVQKVEDVSLPENTVVKALRAGFTIGDRLLRPAQVIVSTGGPKVEPAPASDAASEDGQTVYEPGHTGPGQTVDQET